MTLMMGMLAKNPAATTFGVRGHYTSNTPGTVHTVSGVDFGGPTGLLVILYSYPIDSAITSIFVNSTQFTGGARESFFTSNSTTVCSFGTTTDTSGTITLTLPSSADNVIFSVIRLNTTATTYRAGAAAGSTSATSRTASALDVSSASGGSYILAVSTHGNTNPTTVTTSNLSPYNVLTGDVTSIGTRTHRWYYARAGATSTIGSTTHSWTTATNASLLALSFDP